MAEALMLGVFTAGLGMMGAVSQGNAERRQAEIAARQREHQASIIREESKFDMIDEASAAREARGAQRAGFANAGAAISGSALSVLQETDQRKRERMAAISWRASEGSYQARGEASAFRSYRPPTGLRVASALLSGATTTAMLGGFGG